MPSGPVVRHRFAWGRAGPRAKATLRQTSLTHSLTCALTFSHTLSLSVALSLIPFPPRLSAANRRRGKPLRSRASDVPGLAGFRVADPGPAGGDRRLGTLCLTRSPSHGLMVALVGSGASTGPARLAGQWRRWRIQWRVACAERAFKDSEPRRPRSRSKSFGLGRQLVSHFCMCPVGTVGAALDPERLRVTEVNLNRLNSARQSSESSVW
jgi:hypothetical protein